MKITTKEWLRFAWDDLDVIERLLEDEHLNKYDSFSCPPGYRKIV